MVETLAGGRWWGGLLAGGGGGMPGTAAATTASTGSARAPRRAVSLTVTVGTLRDLVGNRLLSGEIVHCCLGSQLWGWRAVNAVPPDVGLPHHPTVERFQLGGQRDHHRLPLGPSHPLNAHPHPPLHAPPAHTDRR